MTELSGSRAQPFVSFHGSLRTACQCVKQILPFREGMVNLRALCSFLEVNVPSFLAESYSYEDFQAKIIFVIVALPFLEKLEN